MRRYKVVFTPAARTQLAAIEAYIARESSEEVAQGYVSAIVEQCLKLDSFPNRGTPHDDIRPGLRTFAFRRRVRIADTAGVDRVEIDDVFYGGQDAEAQLRPGGRD